MRKIITCEPATTFDPLRYKTTTRAQWEAAAQAWDAWGPFLERWLGPATETMLDLARVGPGASVLDVAAGAGGQTIAAAHRVGETGRIVATDISPGILGYARRRVSEERLGNVALLEMDGEALAFPDRSFDAAISRLGLIYFPNQQDALRGLLRVLVPGGRLGAVVYSTELNNPFFAIPVGIIRRRAGLPPPEPGQPGPFTLAADGVLERAFTAAGFVDVQVVRVHAPLRLPSAADCVRFERESFGALHQMLGGLSDDARAEAWDEIRAALRRFEDERGFTGPCELLVGTGARPGTEPRT
jgi:SAM-dependent methyltransferase